MIWKKLKAWVYCKYYGHDWWYYRDTYKMYKNINMFHVKRGCWKCGLQQLAIPRLGEAILVDSEGHLDLTKFFWVKAK